jgi:RNA polymerase sigma factor (sigma-70 family)
VTGFVARVPRACKASSQVRYPTAIRPPIDVTKRSDNDPPRDSTATLVAKARVGDRSAENEIARRQLPELRRWARGQLPPAARAFGDTEDLVQDTVMRMLERLALIDVSRPGGLQNYLRRSFKNRLIDSLRRSGRRPAGPALRDPVDPRPSPQSELLARESAAKFQAAFEQLNTVDRALIGAWLEREWDYAKIARALKKPTANAARVAVYRACDRLWQHFEPATAASTVRGPSQRRRVAGRKPGARRRPRR